MSNMDPRDLPEVKRDMQESIATLGPDGLGFAYEDLLDVPMAIGIPEHAASAIMHSVELSKTQNAPVYYVTREMTEKALEASESIPKFFYEQEDAPSFQGIVYFEGLREMRNTSPTDMFAWSFMEFKNSGLRNILHVSSYAHSENTQYSDLYREMGVPYGKMIMRSFSMFMTAGQGISDEIGMVANAEDLKAGRITKRNVSESEVLDNTPTLRLLKAAWILMQQEDVSETREAEPSRNSAKRIRRQGGDPGKVRIVDIRRKRYASQGREQYAREYDHRWKVRGHWRNQWYPSRGVHRPKWIEEHVRGPEDAPLIERDTVYRLK